MENKFIAKHENFYECFMFLKNSGRIIDASDEFIISEFIEGEEFCRNWVVGEYLGLPAVLDEVTNTMIICS